MTETRFATLQRAVTIARDRQVRRLEHLRRILRDEGHDEDDIRAAIATWSTYERDKLEIHVQASF